MRIKLPFFKKNNEIVNRINKEEKQVIEQISKQKLELRNTSIFQAYISRILKIVEMCLEKDNSINSIIIETDPNTEFLLDKMINNNEIPNYQIDKTELGYEFRLRTINF